MQHIFIIGAKSIGQYGGYETFVEKLLEYHSNDKDFQYHIACKANGDGSMDETRLEGACDFKYKGPDVSEFTYLGAHVFKIKVPNIGASVAIYYDIMSLRYCISYCKKNDIKNPIVYVLACRIGPFIGHFKNEIRKLEGKLYVNPDGHEWMRSKWSEPVKKYWKLSEKLMVKNADIVVCDSRNIEKYIREEYEDYNPVTTYIAYGAETEPLKCAEDDILCRQWLEKNRVSSSGYYLVVGRFVPENNYETIIREFMKSDTDKDLVFITNDNEKLKNELEEKYRFSQDSRIKFTGPVYDKKLLKAIRQNAYAYLHGHEVGGTNPSLLEALGSTNLNLLLDVGFNREVAGAAALYWTKHEGSLSNLIKRADILDKSLYEELGMQAKDRIRTFYSWEYIAKRYRKLFGGKV